MNRLASFSLVFALFASALMAQSTISGIQIGTDPAGAAFSVDGTRYITTQTFNWPQGSTHQISFLGNKSPTVFANQDDSIEYTFGSWSANGTALGGSNDLNQTVTADPKVTTYIASLSVAYRINLVMFGSSSPGVPAGVCETSGSPGNLPSPQYRTGVVYIAGTCYWSSGQIWIGRGPTSLSAFPFPGYVFTGYSLNGDPKTSFFSTYNLQGQMTLAVYFAPAKRVRFFTSPVLALHVLVDRSDTNTPAANPCPSDETISSLVPFPSFVNQNALCRGEFDFAVGSQHLLSANSPQTDSTGHAWIFDSWSIGGGQNTVYTANTGNVIDTITAKFVPGAHVSFITNPLPLALTVDGRTNWPTYNFIWPVGGTYNFSAPMQATDAKGRKYVFQNWSNGGAAAQSVTVAGDTRFVANYQILNRVVIGSTAPGITVTVDGQNCAVPCTIDRAAGTSAQVTAPSSIPISDTSRYDFAGWQDASAGAARSVTFNQDSQTVNVNYSISNKLIASMDPDGSADIQVSPASTDGFYSAGTVVSLTAAARPGYKFNHWDGDMSGGFRSGTLKMDTFHIVRALFDKVPYISPAGVTSAAGTIPAPGVAAGSLITIFGQSLSTTTQVGPASPLAQTLGDVVVLLGDRFLPLVFVSPTQINALLPSDVAPGSYTLTVKVTGYPDISAPMTVVRNAPGIFSSSYNNTNNYVMAVHADGTLVTPDSPAKANETITIYGTGFGPYTTQPADGFAVPATPVYTLADPTVVFAADTQQLNPVSVVATPGMVGVTSANLKIANLPAGTTVNLRVNVNGQDSNTVLLPLQ
jgi:uncharacterized protein (TIGR03437 family)